MYLAMVTEDGEERRFRLGRERVVLGRDMRCDLRVALPSVSLRHCEITVADDGVLRLSDLGSENGTFHNGARVEQADLGMDDTVTVGSVTFVVRSDQGGDAAAVAEVKPQARMSGDGPVRKGRNQASGKG